MRWTYEEWKEEKGKSLIMKSICIYSWGWLVTLTDNQSHPGNFWNGTCPGHSSSKLAKNFSGWKLSFNVFKVPPASPMFGKIWERQLGGSSSTPRGGWWWRVCFFRRLSRCLRVPYLLVVLPRVQHSLATQGVVCGPEAWPSSGSVLEMSSGPTPDLHLN